MSKGVAFESSDDFNRMAHAVRHIERIYTSPGEVSGDLQYQAGMVVVRVTSSTPVSGLYPGVFTYLNPTTLLWYDGEECRVRDNNNQELTNGYRYVGRVSGVHNEGTSASGTNNGYVVVEVTKWALREPFVGRLLYSTQSQGIGRILNSGGSWVDGTTFTNARVMEIEGVAMTVRPQSNVIYWKDVNTDFFEYMPVQYADYVGTYAEVDNTGTPTGNTIAINDWFPGFVSTGNQRWKGNKQVDGHLTVTFQGYGSLYSPAALLSIIGNGVITDAALFVDGQTTGFASSGATTIANSTFSVTSSLGTGSGDGVIFAAYSNGAVGKVFIGGYPSLYDSVVPTDPWPGIAINDITMAGNIAHSWGPSIEFCSGKTSVSNVSISPLPPPVQVIGTLRYKTDSTGYVTNMRHAPNWLDSADITTGQIVPYTLFSLATWYFTGGTEYKAYFNVASPIFTGSTGTGVTLFGEIYGGAASQCDLGVTGAIGCGSDFWSKGRQGLNNTYTITEPGGDFDYTFTGGILTNRVATAGSGLPFMSTTARGKPTILVPKAPRLEGVERTSGKVIGTVVVGSEAEKLFRLTGPFMRRYAKRVGADLHVLRWPGISAWSMSCKFAMESLLDVWDQMAFFDADTLIRDSVPDVFSVCNPDAIWGVDELPDDERQLGGRAKARYIEFREDLGYDKVEVPWYINTGVLVCSKEHQKYLVPPTKLIPTDHCSEQDYFNAEFLTASLKGEVKVGLLPRQWNWQNWVANGVADAPRDAVLHFSGGYTAEKDRYETVKSWIRYLTTS